jgi:hypothetical protein
MAIEAVSISGLPGTNGREYRAPLFRTFFHEDCWMDRLQEPQGNRSIYRPGGTP